MTVPASMTRAGLEQLIADSKGEWEQIEFKKTTGELHGGMETLCGFLNGTGGKVLFGVTNAGKIQGQEVTDATFQEIANAIRKLEPPAWIEQIRVPVGENREVLILQTTLHADGPYTFDSRPYQRIGNTTSRMPQPEYQRRLLARIYTEHRWENQPAERYRLEDLDLVEVERTHQTAVTVKRLETPFLSCADTLDRFELRREGRLLQAAVVLFGKKQLPDYPQCALRMARFRGTTKDEFIDQRQVFGHAFQLFEEASLFLQRHVAVAGWFEEGKWERQDRPQYPFVALREAVVNAICHRDYTVVGGAVHVAIYDDRLEVISSGLLPPGITVADLKRDHPSRLRNPLIAEPFYRRALIEKWGRGTQKIVEICRAGGYPEPEFIEQAGAVTVRFPLGHYAPPTQVRHDLSERQRLILQLLGDGAEWRFRDILARLPEPPAERTLRDDLQLLKKFGLVDTGGRSVAARWWLKRPGPTT